MVGLPGGVSAAMHHEDPEKEGVFGQDPSGSDDRAKAEVSLAADVVIALGASAGGLETLRVIFSSLKEVPRAAFVIVQHLSPHSRSMLAELLARDANMEVREARDGDELRTGTVLVTPPNADIIVRNRKIILQELHDRAGPKPSIDRLMSSVAQEYAEHAVGIILSGTGSDGALGLRSIKSAGGIAVVQDPKTAKYDGMPRAAVATGVVDLVLAPEEIAAELADIAGLARDEQRSFPELVEKQPYDAIMELLLQRTKIDFSLYKQATIRRRLMRRIAVCRSGDLRSYLDHLKQNPAECQRLFQDLLISVTAFFRDPEMFAALKNELVTYLNDLPFPDMLRIWSPGCASGEEPYSLAILALEAIKDSKWATRPPQLQVFATDIDEEAMQMARKGIYSSASMEGVAPEICTTYFTPVDANFQIRKDVRERVLFARHDLAKDPPFLRMDLISCRNLFIYFSQHLQENILKVFHYALNPGGLLFLGKSETIGVQKHFFRSVDQTARIFRRADQPVDPGISFRKLAAPAKAGLTLRVQERLPSYQDGRLLIRSLWPDCLVLDESLRLLASHGVARKLLTIPEGDMGQDISNLLRPVVRERVMTLIHKCRRLQEQARMQLRFLSDGEAEEFYLLTASYLTLSDGEKLIVGFTDLRPSGESAPAPENASDLERELSETREYLQTVIEEHETTNEELQALNEELQSANEELQSTNEELETANEELQSANEELTTVNQELNVKSAELAELSSYLTAVQNAIESPVLVVDEQMNLVRYNDSARDLFRIKGSEVGRNVRLCDHKIDLEAAFTAIEQTLKVRSRVRTHIRDEKQGVEFDVSCLPVKDDTGKLAGVVATFSDNTELSVALGRALAAESRLFAILSGIPAKISVKSVDGRYTFVNEIFCKTTGFAKEFVLGRTDEELFGPEAGRRRRSRDYEALKRRSVFPADEVHMVNGEAHTYYTARLPLVDEAGNCNALCSVGIDVTDRVRMERELSEFRKLVSVAQYEFILFKLADGEYRSTFVSENICDRLGLPRQALSGLKVQEILALLFKRIPLDHLRTVSASMASDVTTSCELAAESAGDTRYFSLHSHRVAMGDGQHLVVSLLDVTREYMDREVIKHQQEEVQKAARLASLGEMATGIAHELKTPLNTIQGYADLIRELNHQGIPVDDAVMNAVDNIEATVQRISEIIVGLKAIARDQKGREKAVFDLRSTVNLSLQVCEFHLKNKGVSVTTKLPSDPVAIQGFETQVSQVIINLINNAVDAVQINREKWIRIELLTQNGQAMLRLVDSGKGIPEVVATKIMTPFFTTKSDGTGLGLSLSKNLMHQHGGDLTLDMESPNTTFLVSLPLAPAPH